jgi:hypothetical protein
VEQELQEANFPVPFMEMERSGNVDMLCPFGDGKVVLINGLSEGNKKKIKTSKMFPHKFMNQLMLTCPLHHLRLPKVTPASINLTLKTWPPNSCSRHLIYIIHMLKLILKMAYMFDNTNQPYATYSLNPTLHWNRQIA